MSKPTITIVGSFLVGMTIRTSHMPVFGETLIGTDFDMGPGGKGSNQGVGVARLGGNAYSLQAGAFFIMVDVETPRKEPREDQLDHRQQPQIPRRHPAQDLSVTHGLG